MTCELHHYVMIDSQTSRCIRCPDEIHNDARDRPCTRDPLRGCRFGACCLDVDEKGDRVEPKASEWVDVGNVQARDKDGATIIKPRLVRREKMREGDRERTAEPLVKS